MGALKEYGVKSKRREYVEQKKYKLTNLKKQHIIPVFLS